MAGVPAFGAICGASAVANQATWPPLLRSSEYMVPPLLAANRRGPRARNWVARGTDCQNLRVTLKLPDAFDWLPKLSLIVADQPGVLSAAVSDEVGTDA